LSKGKHLPLAPAIQNIEKHTGGLPGHLPSTLKLFSIARNKIVHGGEVSDDEILRAVDSGVTILRALRAIPRETNVVVHTGVKVFQDSICTRPLPGVAGVMLESESAGGLLRALRIFPTTQQHFQQGKRVAWEWNNNNAWGEAWYIDPVSDEKKLAWSSSLEFVGRHLDDL
jgi:hypothetical protein